MMNILNEMARFGDAIKYNKVTVDIELHGGDDRIYPPHIHMYHTSERKTKNKTFTIEVNLAHLFWTDELVPCRILDKKKGIDRKNSTETDWKGYNIYFDIIQDFLYDGEVKGKYENCLDNIAVAIEIFNDEADLTQLHSEEKKKLREHIGTISRNDKFLAVMYCYRKKIKRQFRKYFTKEQQQKFKEIFE